MSLLTYTPPNLQSPPYASKDIQTLATAVENYVEVLTPTIPPLVDRINKLKTRFDNINSRISGLGG